MIDWYLEETQFRRYIALNADDTSIEEVIDHLSNHNVEVISHGPSQRVASNGLYYDWYIRLPLEKSSRLSEAHLRSILASILRPKNSFDSNIRKIDASIQKIYEVIESSESKGGVDSTSDYESTEDAPGLDPEHVVSMIIAKLRDAGISGEFGGTVVKNLINQLDSVAVRDEGDSLLHARDMFLQGIRSLGKELAQLNSLRESDVQKRQSIERDLFEAREKIESLQKSLSEFTELSDPPATTSAINDILEEKAQLEAKLESIERDLNQALEWWRSEQSKNENLEYINTILLNRIDKLRRNLESVGEHPELVEKVFFNILLRTEFKWSSIDTLCRFTDPSATIRMLRGLDDRSFDGGSNVAGAPGWREHHVSTGHSDDGRLYYSIIDGRVHVLIGTKGSQKRDISRLRHGK